jgi:hypothetical protein
VGVDAAGVSGSRDDSIVVPVTRFLSDYRDAFSWQRRHSWYWPLVIAFGAAYAAYQFRSTPSGLIEFLVVWAILMALYQSLSLSIVSSRLMKAHALNGSSYAFSREGYEYRSATSWGAVKKLAETRRSYLIVYPNVRRRSFAIYSSRVYLGA